jgi:hypothetical protein
MAPLPRPAPSSAARSLACSPADVLARARARCAGRYKLFNIWDENGDGQMDEVEFKRAIKMLGLSASSDDFHSMCELCDINNNGTIDLEVRTDPHPNPGPNLRPDLNLAIDLEVRTPRRAPLT